MRTPRRVFLLVRAISFLSVDALLQNALWMCFVLKLACVGLDVVVACLFLSFVVMLTLQMVLVWHSSAPPTLYEACAETPSSSSTVHAIVSIAIRASAFSVISSMVSVFRLVLTTDRMLLIMPAEFLAP